MTSQWIKVIQKMTWRKKMPRKKKVDVYGGRTLFDSAPKSDMISAAKPDILGTAIDVGFAGQMANDVRKGIKNKMIQSRAAKEAGKAISSTGKKAAKKVLSSTGKKYALVAQPLRSGAKTAAELSAQKARVLPKLAVRNAKNLGKNVAAKAAVKGKAAGAALKVGGKAVLAAAKAHPVGAAIAVGTTAAGSLVARQRNLKKRAAQGDEKAIAVLERQKKNMANTKERVLKDVGYQPARRRRAEG